jgi:pimeloyl-ACP methyl ester carboxylesterase
VHFILGSADQMTSPRVTRDIAQALKARIHSLPSGHALMQEAPEAMLAALRASLA